MLKKLHIFWCFRSCFWSKTNLCEHSFVHTLLVGEVLVSLKRRRSTSSLLEGRGGIIAEQLPPWNFAKASLHNHKIAEEGARRTPQETQISERRLRRGTWRFSENTAFFLKKLHIFWCVRSCFWSKTNLCEHSSVHTLLVGEVLVSLKRRRRTKLILEGCGEIIAEQPPPWNFAKASLHNRKIAEEGARRTPKRHRSRRDLCEKVRVGSRKIRLFC